jgi:hypothetical protein
MRAVRRFVEPRPYRSASGITTLNVDPAPFVLRTSILPP